LARPHGGRVRFAWRDSVGVRFAWRQRVRVIANGETVEIDDGARLTDLFEVLGVQAKWVVAEVNGEAVDRAAMSGVSLSEGDRIELVRAVAGG
jgi:sulfur carrier protein